MSMKPKDEISINITLSLPTWAMVLAAIEAAKSRTYGGTAEMRNAALDIQHGIVADNIKKRAKAEKAA